MNEPALARVLAKARGKPLDGPAPCPGKSPLAPESAPDAAPDTAAPDALASLLDTPLTALIAPLAVDSPHVGRIYLVADEVQARAVRAKRGTPYTPSEVAILREMWAAVGRDEWPARLRAIHAAKQEFEGELC